MRIRSIEWYYPQLVGFHYGLFLLFKAYLFITLPHGCSNLDLITMYIKVQPKYV